ncbi:general secretion pathway protein GspB [Fundidesulfovibrio agrisoli]|uniref:general secretion pathway protein GspB n=1 Tax=Fundidesulfovibrio agrisoli TaxID=2922717 RepID=UPI001FAD3511|nr:general secretion pathway protein GspB [Fundidesulfovibrio agrisoli]
MNISKREKILLAVMGTAILIAAAYLLWPSSKPPPSALTPQQLADSKKAGETQLQALEKVQLSEREIQAVKSAQQPWPRDPLAVRPPDPEAQVDRDKFQYTGFVRVGQSTLAVINGREYQTGEQLESGGFEVVEITPEAVVLQGIVRKNKVRIPYQDPSFFTGR